jgi:hypothetical protein
VEGVLHEIVSDLLDILLEGLRKTNDKPPDRGYPSRRLITGFFRIRRKSVIHWAMASYTSVD